MLRTMKLSFSVSVVRDHGFFHYLLVHSDVPSFRQCWCLPGLSLSPPPPPPPPFFLSCCSPHQVIVAFAFPLPDRLCLVGDAVPRSVHLTVLRLMSDAERSRGLQGPSFVLKSRPSFGLFHFFGPKFDFHRRYFRLRGAPLVISLGCPGVPFCSPPSFFS